MGTNRERSWKIPCSILGWDNALPIGQSNKTPVSLWVRNADLRLKKTRTYWVREIVEKSKGLLLDFWVFALRTFRVSFYWSYAKSQRVETENAWKLQKVAAKEIIFLIRKPPSFSGPVAFVQFLLRCTWRLLSVASMVDSKKKCHHSLQSQLPPLPLGCVFTEVLGIQRIDVKFPQQTHLVGGFKHSCWKKAKPQKERLVFQPSFFSSYVCFRGCINYLVGGFNPF